MAHLHLDKAKVQHCRDLAKRISVPIEKMISAHTTVAIERASLRLLGVEGAVERGGQYFPLANIVVDELVKKKNLDGGVVGLFSSLMKKTGLDANAVAESIAKGRLSLPDERGGHSGEKGIKSSASQDQEFAKALCQKAVKHLDQKRHERDGLRHQLEDRFDPTGKTGPCRYVIVATGNIYEDVIQAKAAAQAGAEAIAVIRSTAQSLLDHVPHGATTEGYGGTYATQENFRIMREALDEEGHKLKRYIRLTNYCSGLCMPEIAALGGLERLDFLLNDAMYGILFRDINMKRTLIDQHFSRKIIARAQIVIHTGEDNYLTTADAVENGHQVLASQFINERFALEAKMKEEWMGLGHAQEMNPEHPNVFLLEIARAQMTRDIFPKSPIKFMPPTRYKCGDIFYSHLMDAMFNFVGVLTGQTIQLLGMPTEAMHTPLMQDRWLSIKNANYIFNGAKELGADIQYKSGGIIESWAGRVLEDTVKLLEKIESQGLFKAIENKAFAEVSRREDGGKGAEGVVAKASDYFNPLFDLL